MKYSALFILVILTSCEKKYSVEEGEEALDSLIEEQKSLETPFDKNLQLARKGDATAMFNLGHFYSKGEGVEENDKKAFEWWKKSADLNHTSAIHNVLWAYQNERGVKKNRIEEMKYVKLSAENGNENLYLYLAVQYQYGKGVIKNEKQAFRWISKAYESGNKKAVAFLADCYDRGTGVEENATRAVELYEEAAFAGEKRGVSALVVAYGMGETKNYKRKLMWDLIYSALEEEYVDLDSYKRLYKVTQTDIDEATEEAERIMESVKFQ